MREWTLKAGAPLALSLSADARLSHTNYCDDQIWDLSLGGGEPPALALQTTFGLRARSFRIFPQFIEKDLVRIDQESFNVTPTIRRFAPNYLYLTFSPFTEIEVRLEYWIPESQSAGCRVMVKNTSHMERSIRMEWIGLLLPSESGEPMAAREINGIPALIGRTSLIHPLIFMTGGPQLGAGPFPSLYIDLELKPDERRKFIWSHAALSSPEASLELAQRTASRNWEAELTRTDIVNSGLVEVFTGDPDWDAAFSLAQKTALGLFHTSPGLLSHPSYVQSRRSTQGFSLRGDGLDYSHQWNGQNPFETYYLASLLLPSSPDLLKGLLENFLSTINDDGFVDWKPGLAGQRSKILATPMLASLAERIYETDLDLAFLEKSFPALQAFARAWFDPGHDRDRDGIPEWSHPMQSGYEDNPLFAPWSEQGLGADISAVETPSLCAFLYHECQSLARIASLIGEEEAEEKWMLHSNTLREAVEIAWDSENSIYRYLDRDSHFSSASQLLAIRKGTGSLNINQRFEHPVRLIIKVKTHGDRTPHPQAFIHGTGINGLHVVERVQPERFHWYLEKGSATSSRVFHQVEYLLIEGLEDREQVTIQTVGLDYLDHSLLLPLWAGIPAEERVQELVVNTVASEEKFWQPFGLPALVGDKWPLEVDKKFIYLPWNALIGEGLLAYGFQKEAAELLSRLMNAVIRSLKRDGCFRKFYHAETGEGLGEQNSLEGLAPLGFFLDTLGVKINSPKCVTLRGINPFPWPITVKYRGLNVLRQSDKTTVIFPDGTTTTVAGAKNCTVSLD